MNNQEFFGCLSRLEELVENSPGFMGKRFVNEEEFYTEILKIRKKLENDDSAPTNSTDKTSPWSDQK